MQKNKSTNPFKKLGEAKEVPPKGLRKKVRDKVALSRLMVDLSELYLNSIPGIIKDLPNKNIK